MTLGSASLDTESLLGSELSHSGPEALPGPAVTARKTRVLLLLRELSRTGAPRVALDALDAMRDEVEVRTIAPLDGPLAEDCRAIRPLPSSPSGCRATSGRGRMAVLRGDDGSLGSAAGPQI